MARWAELADGVDAIVWEAIPTTHRFTYVSPAAERMLGYPRARWLEHPDFWVGIVHPEDRTAVDASRASARSGEHHEYECRVVDREGRTIWLRNLVRVVTDAEGRVALLRGLMIDVTRLKEAEVALRTDAEHYRLLSEYGLDLFSLHAPDGRILYASRACREIVGYEPEELIGKGLDFLIHPEDLPEMIQALGQVLQGQVPPSVVFRALHKAGEPRWCETKGSLVSPREGLGEVRVVGVTRDISERRILQEALAKAQRLEALGRLSGGIAHDFNNLFTVIQGHLEFLRHGVADRPELIGDLEETSRAVARASSLTRQLLTFGRRDLSRPRILDLSQTLRDLEPLVRRLIPENIRVRTNGPQGPLPVRLDPAQFEQVFVNLVANARDAMRSGGDLAIELVGRTVEASGIERMRGIQAGAYAVFRVSDTGQGMDASTLARIFEPFFTTKGTERGTGLGLSVVDGVVRQSGGQVLVESEPGKGTTFEIWLPLSDPTGGDDGSDRRARTESSVGSGATILLVEDEPSVRSLIVSVLERAGFRVLPSASMEEALAAYLRYEAGIHLLLSHVVLPRGTGIELARRLRHDRPDLPVLLTVEESDRGGAELAGGEKGVHLISKPFTAEGLISAVRGALEAR